MDATPLAAKLLFQQQSNADKLGVPGEGLSLLQEKATNELRRDPLLESRLSRTVYGTLTSTYS
jgi:hypothetical protein